MTRRLIVALVLGLSPLAAFAECGREHAASMSCPEGHSWNTQTKTCEPMSS
ncbi:MAG: chitin-binding domain-containing protein [Paracoccaceae bacterium]